MEVLLPANPPGTPARGLATDGAASPKLSSMASDQAADETLMLRYASGDARAFELLYGRHRGPLWRFLSRQLRNETTTADVFQETWSRVISHRLRYEPRAKFGTWLYRIAHHCCVDHWRRTGRRVQHEVADPHAVLEDVSDDDARTPSQIVEDGEAAERLQTALAELPDVQRETFLLYAEAGLDLPAIAVITGVGTETAKSRLRYAAAKLKRALATAPQGEP